MLAACEVLHRDSIKSVSMFVVLARRGYDRVPATQHPIVEQACVTAADAAFLQEFVTEQCPSLLTDWSKWRR